MTDARLPELSFLIVDDSRVMIKMVRAMLESLGVRDIDIATNANEAEEKLKQRRFDNVFMDWRMSGKSGVALIEQFRGDRSYDSVAFVIVSGESGERYIHEAMKSGAALYIVKPFTAEDLQKHLDTLIKWHEQRGRFGKKAPGAK